MKKRKKYIEVLLLIVVIIIISVFLIVINCQKQVYEYYLGNNENNYFDAKMHSVVLPSHSQAAFFDEKMLDQMAQNNPDIEIYPYYPLMFGGFDESKGYPIEITQEKTVSYILPYVIEEYDVISRMDIVSYTDEQKMLDNLKVVHSFDSDSGIYIPQNLCDRLGILYDKDCKHLTIKGDIYAPVSVQIQQMQISYKDSSEADTQFIDYESYSIVDYEKKEFTLEIEGVVDIDDPGSFLTNISIAIPYEMSEDIYSLISKETFLSQDTIAWNPQIYIVRTTESSMEKLGNQLLSDINSFALYKHNYSNAEHDCAFFEK